MQEPTRLFDLLDWRKSLHPERPVFKYKEDGQWQSHYIDEYIEKANLISYALLHLGVQRGENIGLISAGRPEWNYIDFGVQQTGAVLLPIYPTISEDDYRFILSDAKVRLLVVETPALYKKITSIREQLPTLENLCTIVPMEGVKSLADIYQLGRDYLASHPDAPQQLQSIKDSLTTDDVCTLIYTSGTTGTPKGVMLAHRGLIMNVQEIKESPSKTWTRALSWLPMCHIYERMMGYLYQWLCFEIAYAESIAKVGDNCKEIHPHMLACVPRFIEKVYDKIYRKGEKLTGTRKKIFDWALNLAFRYDLDESHLSLGYKLQKLIADKLVYKEIRESMGGCLGMLVSGGATIQPRLTRFFSCVGLDLYEGYGITECSPLIAVTNSNKKGRKIGSVGFAMREIEVRINPDTNEIQCRGGNVMKGYYNQPELTAQAIDPDGWFHTGDTGYFDPDGYLFITGRTKSMFKTSMGKFINPEVIEEKMKQSPFILDMMVVGADQKYAAALIAPDFDMLRDWCRRHGVSAESHEQMIADRAVVARFQKVVDKYNTELGVTEQIKRFTLVPDAWNENNRMLTPTQKLIRRNVEAAYKEQINDLFK
ncbi:MAG: long-chain fatty acid--CoA ligase [Bacteroidales bacterium]|nr:long-chain fatty acid--CoA ligase [Bacteroidales bacterium]